MMPSKFFLGVGEMWLTLGCSPVPVATGLVFDVCRG